MAAASAAMTSSTPSSSSTSGRQTVLDAACTPPPPLPSVVTWNPAAVDVARYPPPPGCSPSAVFSRRSPFSRDRRAGGDSVQLRRTLSTSLTTGGDDDDEFDETVRHLPALSRRHDTLDSSLQRSGGARRPGGRYSDDDGGDSGFSRPATSSGTRSLPRRHYQVDGDDTLTVVPVAGLTRSPAATSAAVGGLQLRTRRTSPRPGSKFAVASGRRHQNVGDEDNLEDRLRSAVDTFV